MSRNRKKVAALLLEAFQEQGYVVAPDQTVDKVAENIWTAEGGATKLDVARWGVVVSCMSDEIRIRIHIGSFATLAQAASEKTLPLIGLRGNSYEV